MLATWPALRALVAGFGRGSGAAGWRWRSPWWSLVVFLLPRGESVQEMTRLVWGWRIPAIAWAGPYGITLYRAGKVRDKQFT